ncbi:MAG: hypothetical protein Q4G35_13095, partial [Propionibacteriaceae bacterium]|nr:hypothetical protein [Propionibacteriaceae bacterium]
MALKTSTTWLVAAAFGLAAVGGGLLASFASPTEPPVPAITSTTPAPTPSADMDAIVMGTPTEVIEVTAPATPEALPETAPAPAETPAVA